MNFHSIVADASRDAVVVVDPESYGILYANKTFSQLLGYRDPATLTFEGISSSASKFLHKLSQGFRFNLECDLLHEDGSDVPTEIHFSPVYEESGSIQAWTAVIRPITKRKQLQSSMMHVSDRLNSILETTTDIVILDDTHTILYANSATKNILGYSDTAMVPLEKIYTPHSLKTLQEDAIPHAISHGTWTGETTFLDKSGNEIPTSHLLIAHKSASGELLYFSTIARDIREQKQNEESLRLAKEKAEAATRAKSEFLANMSHEIRTPLNGILGFSEILAQSVSDPNLITYTKSISTSGRNLLHLINDILDLSKIEAGKLTLEPTPTHLEDILHEVASLFQLQADEKNLKFSIESDLEHSHFLLDPTRLRQVLFNLAANAVKYTQQGFVAITVSESSRVGDSVTLTFTIEDSGPGIAPDHLAEIFDTFTQKHSTAGGAGLGLAITQRLLRIMGGTIDLDSTLGSGSTFRVVLPGVKLTEGDIVAPAESSGPVDFQNATLLIADDLDTNLELIRLFLEDCNLHIIEATNGPDVLKFTQTYNPSAILVDWVMPELHAPDIIEFLKSKAQTRDIPVIVATAKALKEEEDCIRDLGASGFIAKPFSQAALIAELKQFLPYETSSTDVTEDSSSWDPKHLEPLLHQLSGPLMEHYDEVKNSPIPKHIKQFIHALETANYYCQEPTLQQFIQTLSAHTNAYDLEKMSQALSTFPKLVDNLQSTCSS